VEKTARLCKAVMAYGQNARVRRKSYARKFTIFPAARQGSWLNSAADQIRSKQRVRL